MIARFEPSAPIVMSTAWASQMRTMVRNVPGLVMTNIAMMERSTILNGRIHDCHGHHNPSLCNTLTEGMVYLPKWLGATGWSQQGKLVGIPYREIMGRAPAGELGCRSWAWRLEPTAYSDVAENSEWNICIALNSAMVSSPFPGRACMGHQASVAAWWLMTGWVMLDLLRSCLKILVIVGDYILHGVYSTCQYWNEHCWFEWRNRWYTMDQHGIMWSLVIYIYIYIFIYL